MTFREFFVAATGHDPYPYQRRLAEGEPLSQLLHTRNGASARKAMNDERSLSKCVFSLSVW
jgi:hypothetical protein